jgi:hypothetical protein
MPHQRTTFEVRKIFERPSLHAIVLQGRIGGGMVVSDMIVKIWVNGGLYMAASIKSIEYIDGLGGESAVGLVLDTPEPAVRELWLEQCLSGDVLLIDRAQIH